MVVPVRRPQSAIFSDSNGTPTPSRAPSYSRQYLRVRLRTPGNQNVLETRQLELLPLLFSWVALSRFWLSNISCLVPRGQVCWLAGRLLAAPRGVFVFLTVTCGQRWARGQVKDSPDPLGPVQKSAQQLLEVGLD